MNLKSRENNNAWSSGEDDPLWLLTPEEFASQPDGIVVESIFGERKTKGIDYIDQDTRLGFIAYGFRESEFSQA